MKILIIRFSSIGDIILCTPVFRACKNQLNAEIHLLTKDTYRSLIQDNENIDHIISFKHDPIEKLEPVLSERYDHVIDLQRNIRSIRFRRKLKAPSFTFPKLNVKKWVLVNFKRDFLPDRHIVDRYFEALQELGVINDQKGLDFQISDSKKKNVEPILTKIEHSPFIAFVLGATYYTKRIPLQLCKDILNKIKVPVILIGGPEEEAIGKLIAEEFLNVQNTCGQLSIHESAAIIQAAQLVITGDTGMMHIAAALQKKIFIIWGNTVPAFGMGPYKTEYRDFEVKDLKCRPCSKLGHHQCPKKHFKCMLEQNIPAIIEGINEVFDKDLSSNNFRSL